MDITVYVDRVSRHERQQLSNALQIVWSLQRFFFPSIEIKEITLPGDVTIDPEQAIAFLANAEPTDACKVCVTSRAFTDEWFFHVYPSNSVISISDWEKVLAPPSLTSYLVYALAQVFITFAAHASEVTFLKYMHKRPRACLGDFCNEKEDIHLGMASGMICPKCRGGFHTMGASDLALDAASRMLNYVRAEAIGQPMVVEPNLAFVVMRFTKNDENDYAYEHGIRPGLEAVGFTVNRGNSVVQSGQILDKVQRFIDKSRIVIAKVDENNLNVYFELGLAIGADKDVLLISEEKLVLNLPSDLKNWECLTYERKNYDQLRGRVSEFFEATYCRQVQKA